MTERTPLQQAMQQMAKAVTAYMRAAKQDPVFEEDVKAYDEWCREQFDTPEYEEALRQVTDLPNQTDVKAEWFLADQCIQKAYNLLNKGLNRGIASSLKDEMSAQNEREVERPGWPGKDDSDEDTENLPNKRSPSVEKETPDQK